MRKQYHIDDLDIWIGWNPRKPPVPIQGYSNHFEVQGPGPVWYLFVRKDSNSCFEVYKANLDQDKHGFLTPESWTLLSVTILWLNGPTDKQISKFVHSL